MTTLNPDVAALVPPRPSREQRLHLALSAALAVAAIAVGGTSAAVLVSDAGATSVVPPAPPVTAAPSPATAPAAGAPVASGAPAAPPAAPVAAPTGPVPAAPAAPVETATGAPVVTDAAGTALPAAVAGGIRTLDTALGTGDVAALRAAYAPQAGSAPWPAVEQVMTDPRARAGLRTALRTPPQARADVPYVYASEGYRLGVDAAGQVRFVRAP